jgi:hypothetical protein
VYDEIGSICPGSDFFEIRRKSGWHPHICWRFLARTTPGHPPNLGQTWPGLLTLGPGLLFVVSTAGEFFDLDQAGQHGLAAVALALEHQFIDEALAAPAVVDEEIFEFFEAMQMSL